MEKDAESGFEALEETEIPVKTFQPTHVNRNHELFLDSLKLAKLGGTIDLTCEDFPHGLIEDGKDPVIGLLEEARRSGVPMERMTLSSDGQGSWSNYDEYGNLVEMGVTDVGNMYAQLRSLVLNGGFVLSEALSFSLPILQRPWSCSRKRLYRAGSGRRSAFNGRSPCSGYGDCQRAGDDGGRRTACKGNV